MSPLLEKYLAKFDRLIENGHYNRISEAYQRVFAWEELPEVPFIWQDLPPIPDEDWPLFEYNDTFADREKMLLDQLRAPFFHYQAGDYHPLNIRTNYGTVILPNILGAEFQLTETSLPWAHHLPDRDSIRRLVEAGIPDPYTGLGRTCFETAEYYMETLSHYPNLSQVVNIYHPDLQGPFDVAHLLWGPDIFLALYDCPELVHALLDLVTETYIVWLKRWKEFIGEGNDFTPHWSYLMRGGTMVRDDTPVMLSTTQYEEFVKPYDQRILDTFGGCIHYCGCGDQFVSSMVTSENLYGLNISQPELNNMERIWELCQEHRIVLLGIDEAFVPQDARRGVVLLRSWERNHPQ
ncbi:MAG: hypothetical protein J7M05_11140 [Anaerolineae bacterium]|nr:hypothetical protein [Anaerolineae bacterium]